MCIRIMARNGHQRALNQLNKCFFAYLIFGTALPCPLDKAIYDLRESNNFPRTSETLFISEASSPEVDSPVIPVDERKPEQLLRDQSHLPVGRAGELHDGPLDGIGNVDGAVAVVQPEHDLSVVLKVGEAVAQILGGISINYTGDRLLNVSQKSMHSCGILAHHILPL